MIIIANVKKSIRVKASTPLVWLYFEEEISCYAQKENSAKLVYIFPLVHDNIRF